MVPVYFKIFQLIFNEKLSTSEFGSLILKNVPNLATSRHEHVSRSQILPKEIYIKKIQNYMVIPVNNPSSVCAQKVLHISEYTYSFVFF